MIIDPLFKSSKLDYEGQMKLQDIGERFSFLLYALEDICPNGRAFSIVRTKLEEASFYAKKSIVILHQVEETTGTKL